MTTSKSIQQRNPSTKVASLILQYLVAHPEGCRNADINRAVLAFFPEQAARDHNNFLTWNCLEDVLEPAGLVRASGPRGSVGRVWFPVENYDLEGEVAA